MGIHTASKPLISKLSTTKLLITKTLANKLFFNKVLSVLGLIPLIIFTGCGMQKPLPPQKPQFNLIYPSSKRFDDQATYQSTLESINNVPLAAEIDGRIIAMPMYEGQKVKKGALLFTLDQIQQKATADSSAAEARKDLVNAERYIFLNNQGAVSTKDRDYYVTAAIQSADQARSDKATLGYKNVVAPINGTVGNINHKLGSVVRSGESIVNIVDNSRLWLRLDVPGELSYRLKLGMPVQLDVSNKPEIRVNGNVSFIAPALDKQTQTLLIKATFDNPSGVLRNNQRVSARLLFAASTSLAIPEAAVFLQAGKTFVFTAVSPAEARRMLGRPIDKQALPGSLVALQMPVELGTLENGFYPVRNGLGASDRLVLGNLAQITSGAVVASK